MVQTGPQSHAVVEVEDVIGVIRKSTELNGHSNRTVNKIGQICIYKCVRL